LEEGPVSTPLRKLGKTLGELVTYISNNAGYIVNYGERFRAGERVSTGFVGAAVNQIVDKHFDKRQSMRWTPRGAHLLLQTRTRVLNGDLDQLIRRRDPAFRKPAGNDRQATTLRPFCDGLQIPRSTSRAVGNATASAGFDFPPTSPLGHAGRGFCCKV
jgi:hypothetical protein